MLSDGSQVIHIVDDDEAVRDSLKLSLEAEGYAALTYASSLAFLEMAPPPAAAGYVLLDLERPPANTLELLVTFRESFSSLPVIVMMEYRDDGFETRARRNGAAALIEKPFHVSELIRIIVQLAPE